jgi:hypothetical protein
MTAPLPPIASIPREYHAEVQDFAKCAVREALERAARIADDETALTARRIRAMLKEYEG